MSPKKHALDTFLTNPARATRIHLNAGEQGVPLVLILAAVGDGSYMLQRCRAPTYAGPTIAMGEAKSKLKKYVYET